MEKLPSTSYLRMVDIWLITTQLVPFLGVVIVTFSDLFEDHDSIINHHGFKRNVNNFVETKEKVDFCIEYIELRRIHSIKTLLEIKQASIA